MNAKENATADLQSTELQSAVRDLISAKGLPKDTEVLFMSYLNTGKLDERLTRRCEDDEACREALDILFDAQLKALRQTRHTPQPSSGKPSPQTASRRLAVPAKSARVSSARQRWFSRIPVREMAGALPVALFAFVAGMWTAGDWSGKWFGSPRLEAIPVGRVLLEGDNDLVIMSNASSGGESGELLEANKGAFLVRMRGDSDVQVDSIRPVDDHEAAAEQIKRAESWLQDVVRAGQSQYNSQPTGRTSVGGSGTTPTAGEYASDIIVFGVGSDEAPAVEVDVTVPPPVEPFRPEDVTVAAEADVPDDVPAPQPPVAPAEPPRE